MAGKVQANCHVIGFALVNSIVGLHALVVFCFGSAFTYQKRKRTLQN